MEKGPDGSGGAAPGHQVKVHARDGATYGPVVAGQTLCFRAVGRWWDWFIPCGPEGYRNFPADVLDIHPVVEDVPYFCLMAEIVGSADPPIRLGREANVQLPASGMLRFFANDAKGLEWNNWGSIEVHITACDCPPIREASDRYDGIPGFWTLVRDVLERTRGILFSAILALGTCLVLALSQPGRDVARAVGEGDFSTAGGQQIAFALLLLFLAVQAWLWPRMVITSNYGRDRRKWRPRWLLDWLPRVLGGLPFVIVWFALQIGRAHV